MTTDSTIISLIQRSKKYRDLYRPTIERVVRDSLKRFGEKRAEKEAKNKLHQIWGAYYTQRKNYKLADHSSTRERLSHARAMFQQIFKITGKPKSIADYGCGLNPLFIPEMNLPAGTRYTALDIDLAEIKYLNQAVTQLAPQIRFEARVHDLLGDPPVSADIALLLKLLPVLEQQQPGISRELLDKIPAKYLVVSFPTASLSSKKRGMRQFYSENFKKLLAGREQFEEISFPEEIFFVIKR